MYETTEVKQTNKLFATFSDKDNIDGEIDRIKNNFPLLYDKIFVLDIKGSKEVLITYHIDIDKISKYDENQLISVHRKKDTNTLYTINALNEVIKKDNNGVLNKAFQVDWKKYKNSVLLIDSNGLKIMKTKLYSIENTLDI